MKDQFKPFLNVLQGKGSDAVPFWMMRQAGRYLPEYREVREKAGGFLNLVFDPDQAAEVTIQPLRRYGMDAAILFSDILIVPIGLGQDVRFEKGEGPVLKAVRTAGEIDALNMDRFDEKMGPIYETVRTVRSGLKKEGFDQTALIGFAGAPWTVACYMVEGGSSKSFTHVKGLAYAESENFGVLIDKLTTATIRYLSHQIDAGAEAVQIFDSWANMLDESAFKRWSIEPTKKIVAKLKEKHPDVPIIGFPRGAGVLYERYIRETAVTAAGLDFQVPLDWAAKTLQPLCPVQGNLDPACLLAGGDNLVRRTEEILEAFGNGPHVFNLGHGIMKETPPVHVELMARTIRNWKR